MNRILIALPLLSLLVGCGSGQKRELLPFTEVVLKPGMSVKATNINGTVTITAGAGTLRTFDGKGWKKERRLIPRETRWYGSLGLYDPAESFSPYGRLLVDEGLLHFASISEALRYFYAGSAVFKPVFTNDGLFFGFHINPLDGRGEPTRSLEIWQIYINGKKPTQIPGADDSAITISGGTTPEESTPYPAPIGYTKVLGDKEYDPRTTTEQSGGGRR